MLEQTHRGELDFLAVLIKETLAFLAVLLREDLVLDLDLVQGMQLQYLVELISARPSVQLMEDCV
jgi:hypothetical protein